MDVISNKLNNINKIYKTINEMDAFSIRLGNVEKILKVRGKTIMSSRLMSHHWKMGIRRQIALNTLTTLFFYHPNICQILDPLMDVRTKSYLMYIDLMENMIGKAHGGLIDLNANLS